MKAQTKTFLITEDWIMNNMMKEYLKDEYSDSYLKNFCRYWMKAYGGSGDEWRRKNDLDCLYFDGDLLADTLMSAWTPIKWVADLLNEEKGIRFHKYRIDSDDPLSDLRMLSDDCEQYLPKNHKLVKLLYEFLALAEQRCNYILLPNRKMNRARYKDYISGEEVWLYDEVPATLSHLFDQNSLGRFFLGSNNEVDIMRVTGWVAREHLEMGFENNEIAPENVRPLISGLSPYEAKWLNDEHEIEQALEYMIDFLQNREDRLKK